MARFKKIEVMNTTLRTKIVPVFYNKDIEVSKQVVKACYDGGIRVFEFTNRGDFAHEVFEAVIKYAEKECPEMILGIGSVIEPATAALYMQLGANFVVGPYFNPEISKICNRRQIPYLPGCGTVTEIGMAHESGCDICKVFPAGTVGGPAFVKNILGPLPFAQIMVTGAVEPSEENLKGWFDAGVSAVGMGSKLFPKKVIESGEWNKITELCKEVTTFANSYKKNY